MQMPPWCRARALDAQRRFGTAGYWNKHNLGIIRDHLPPRVGGVLETQTFFFIAAANDRGERDCSFRGREFNVSGQPYPLLKILDARPLAYPRLQRQQTLQLPGQHPGQSPHRHAARGFLEPLAIIEDRRVNERIWLIALRYARVTGQRAYPKCKPRIPKIGFAPLTDAFFEE